MEGRDTPEWEILRLCYEKPWSFMDLDRLVSACNGLSQRVETLLNIGLLVRTKRGKYDISQRGLDFLAHYDMEQE